LTLSNICQVDAWGFAVPDEACKGLAPGGIRLSAGLEDWHDIIEDLEEALAQI
jgi:O-acetylhomoserine/O-acetylserine sulfhydrylase-like pyridoxal-dependent enzyme